MASVLPLPVGAWRHADSPFAAPGPSWPELQKASCAGAATSMPRAASAADASAGSAK